MNAPGLERLKALAQAARTIMGASDLASTLQAITDSARNLIGAHQAICSLTRSPDWSQAVTAVSLTDKYKSWRDYSRMPDGSGIYSWVCEGNLTVRMTQAELEAHPRWRRLGRHAHEHPPMRGWLATALTGSDGRNLGLIQLSDKIEGGFDEVDEAIVVQLAQLASSAIERTQAEEALRESEAQLRVERKLMDAVIRQAPVGISVTEAATGRPVVLNDKAVELLGHAPHGDSVRRYENFGAVHPDGRPYALGDYPTVRALEQGEVIDQEEMIYRRGGPSGAELTRFAVSSAPVRDEGGAIIAAATIVVDIEQQRRAEAAIRESEEQLRQLTDALPLFVSRIGRDERYQFVNKTYEAWFGKPRDAILGRTIREVLGDEAYAARRDAIDAALRGESVRFETFTPMPGGERRDTDIHYLPRRLSDGTLDGFYVLVSDISDRKGAEAALRESEARLSDILESMNDFYYALDADFRFIEANRRIEEITGKARSELIGRTIWEAFPKAAGTAAYGEPPPPGERRVLNAEGYSEALGTWVEGTVYRTHDRMEVYFRDISGRKEAETRLRESEAKFQAIANSIDQMIWSTRPDGYHDYYNQRWYDFTGVPQGSTDGEGWNDMFHPEDQERAWARWRHSLETGEPYHIEYRLKHRSGQYRWVLGRAQPVRDEKGGITRWFGTCTDIQDIVEAREVLARSRRDLERLVEARTAERDKIWQNSNELMAMFSYDGRRLAINPSWSRVLGYDEETLVNKPMHEITHPDDVEDLKRAVQRLMRGEIIDPFEDRLRHADGTYRTISWTGVPGDGVFYAIGRDVTEQRQAEEQLRQAQKMEAVGQLTGGVAHDFNNLLTIIKSSTDLLRRPDLSEERRRRYVDAIADTVDRASRLTGQLLAFARRQALKPEVLDVAARIRGITDMLRTIVGSRIRIVTDVACEDCIVEADVSQFETAIVNMAVNARDAMEGEGTLTIRIHTVPDVPGVHARSELAAVSLSDTGSGIPPERLSHIFEPFFTTKEVGKGTGLGLSQVYGFAKQSGGDVDVESAPGRGTTFTLYLPKVDGEAALASPSAGAANPSPVEHGRGLRVLVVEDNAEVGAFSTQILEDLGYETTLATNGHEALEQLSRGLPYDAVFSDVVMPGMGGIELGHEVRRRYPGLPVVLTSGYSEVLAEEGRHGFELLHKPYAAEELSRVLRRVMRGRSTAEPAV
ncbi:MAG TPA: PAS domain S-box protein [Microvirga sp.]|jgi:PAS domain S-box-containing protein|nr:PAS domain S-box protein [Microvirga sp.]